MRYKTMATEEVRAGAAATMVENLRAEGERAVAMRGGSVGAAGWAVAMVESKVEQACAADSAVEAMTPAST